MKKRVLAGLLAGVMMLGLTACGGGPGGNEVTNTPPTEQQDDGLPTLDADIALPTEEIAALMSTSVQHDSMTIDAGKLNINPVKLYDSGTELYSMYEMLFQVAGGLGSEMRPTMADADRGEFGGYDHEAGSSVYTFYINDNIYDHDGNHFTASDAAFSFRMTKDGGQVSGWDVVQSWEAKDDTTLVTDLLWRAQNNQKKIIIGIMPESANNIGRFFGAKTDRNEMARLAAVCRKAGAYEVLDLTGLRDLAVSELGPEITRRKEAGEKTAVSICPAEKYREGQQKEILWGRNPEVIFREKAVELFLEKGISEEELFLVYVSPCTAAKRSHDSDAVLTTVELFQWIQRACVSRYTTLDVWNKAEEEAALPLLKDYKASIDENEATVVYACPGGCANGGGQFRAKAYQK